MYASNQASSASLTRLQGLKVEALTDFPLHPRNTAKCLEELLNPGLEPPVCR